MGQDRVKWKWCHAVVEIKYGRDIFNSRALVVWIRFDVLSPSGVIGPSGSAAVIRWSDARPSDRSYKAQYARCSSNVTLVLSSTE